jgi:hypothetical protein
MLWLKRFWRKKEVLPPPAGFAEVYHRIEKLLTDLEIVSHLLDDTEDWQRLSEDAKKCSMESLSTFYKRAHFQTSCLRDEMLLTLQRIPNVKLIRKSLDVKEETSG